jgi:tetratricopeptide (TPR) repeat protein
MLVAQVSSNPDFLEKLYLVKGDPLTYVAFLVLILGWLGPWYLFNKRVYPRILEQLPKAKRITGLRMLLTGIPDEVTDQTLRATRWRFLLLAYGMTLLFLLIIAGLLVHYLTMSRVDVLARLGTLEQAQAEALQRMINAQNKLDQRLAERQDKGVILDHVLRFTGQAIVIAQRLSTHESPEVQSQATHLQRAIDDFLALTDRAVLPEPVKRSVELAQATVEQAKGNNRKAIELANPNLAADLIRLGTAELQEGVIRTRIIATSRYGIGEWPEAAKDFQEIIRTPYATEMDKAQLVNCQVNMDKKDEALVNCNRFLLGVGPNVAEKGLVESGGVVMMLWTRAAILSGPEPSQPNMLPTPNPQVAADLLLARAILEKLAGKGFDSDRGRAFWAITDFWIGRLSVYGAAFIAKEKDDEATKLLGEGIARLRRLGEPIDAEPGAGDKIGVLIVDRKEVLLDLAIAYRLRADIMSTRAQKVPEGPMQEWDETSKRAISDYAEALALFALIKKRKWMSQKEEQWIPATETTYAFELFLRGSKFYFSKSRADCVKPWKDAIEIWRRYPGEDRADRKGRILALTYCAKVLATYPDAAVRDGPLAVTFATWACKLTKWQDPTALGVLAAAEAEKGDFESAIKYQNQAIEKCPEAQRSREQRRLTLYQAGKPWRISPPK